MAELEDDVLPLRFSFMLQCEDPTCGQFSLFSPTDRINGLHSRRFYCYMNPNAEVSQCPHKITASDQDDDMDESAGSSPVIQTSGGKKKRSKPGARLSRKGVRSSRDTLLKRGSSKKKMQPRRPKKPSPSSTTSSVSSDVAGVSSSANTSPSRDVTPQPTPIREFNIGNNVMVHYGKTVYLAKVIATNKPEGLYLVKYDGLSSNRNEWRYQSDLISIDDVSGARRRRAPVSTFAPLYRP